MSTDVRVIKSYVWHGDDCFFVSTINRKCSSMQGGRYPETMVWLFDWKKNKRISGTMQHGAEDSEDSIHGHLITCQRLHDTGSPYEKEE